MDLMSKYILKYMELLGVKVMNLIWMSINIYHDDST